MAAEGLRSSPTAAREDDVGDNERDDKDEASAESAEPESDPSIDQMVLAAIEKSGVKKQSAKGTIAATVFALAALLSSIANIMYGGEDRVSTIVTKEDNITETAYEKLRAAIDKQSDAIEKNQEDLLSMRNFLAGFIQAMQTGSRPATAPRPVASVEALLPPVREPAPPPPLPKFSDVKYEAIVQEQEAKK